MLDSLTAREKKALAFGALALWGYFSKGWTASAAKYAGSALLANEVYGWWQEQQLFANPDTMNGYFRTGGKVSGKDSSEHAKVIRRGGLVK